MRKWTQSCGVAATDCVFYNVIGSSKFHVINLTKPKELTSLVFLDRLHGTRNCKWRGLPEGLRVRLRIHQTGSFSREGSWDETKCDLLPRQQTTDSKL